MNTCPNCPPGNDAVTVTAAVCVTAVPLIVAETVLAPVTVELSVPVATPFPSVVPLGWVSVLPLPVAASTTVAPLSGVPLPSFTVTVTVALPLPAVSDLGVAATVACEADTAAAVTVTAAVCVTAVPLIVAETVFASVTLELRAPVATPVVLVIPLGWVSVLPLPVAARTTVAPLIRFPYASFAVTVIVDVPLPTTTDVGEAATVDCAAETGPATTVTLVVCVIPVPLAVAETVLAPVTVELSVPVATPFPSVVPLGWVSVLPLPVAASTTVAPLSGVPLPSFTVTVTVALPLPAVSDLGVAATVACEADTAAAVTVTAAVCVTAVPLIVAETVFASVTLELRAPVATPVVLVIPLGWVSVLPLPVAARTTVAPLIRFPYASFAVTVIVDVPLPTTTDVGEAATVDCAAETGPATTVTLVVCVIPVPLAVAETVLAPVTVELSVPVATPFPSVVPLGWVSVLPLPVAASTTVAPLSGVPLPSFTVTVTVALPLPAVSDVGVAATVDCEADTAAAVTVTAAVCVTAVPLIVAETVFASVTLELRAPVATPVVLVIPLGWVSVLPLPVAARTTVAPLIRFPYASFAVTVIVDVPLPTTTDVGEAATVDCAAETGPATTVTLVVCVIPVPLAVAETVLAPVTVELSVPVATPFPSVVPLGWVSVLPLPVAASTTVAPLSGVPLPSFTVTVTVALPLPAVSDLGVAATVACEADTAAAVTVTAAVCVTAVPLIVAETVFASVTLELRAPVATPVVLVIPLGWVSVLPLPVAASTTVAPLTRFPYASFAVTVIVDVPLPTTTDVGEAATVDCAAETGPATTVTLVVCVIPVPLAVAETVLAPVTVELSVPVTTPLASVVPLGWVSVLPLPVAASTTVAPLSGVPLASFTVTVTVALPLPAVSDVGVAASVDCEADMTGQVTATLAVSLFEPGWLDATILKLPQFAFL